MDGTGVLFQPLLDILPLSLVAHAQRYPTHEALSYDDLVARVLAALPREGDYVLVAESFSGPIALRAAATQPRGLRALVLCASFAEAPVRVPAWLTPFVRPGLMRMSPFALQAPVMLGMSAPASLRALLAEALAAVSPEVLAHRARELLRVDASEALSALHVPLLYLRATRDRLVSARSRDHLLHHCPDATVADIQGPHLLMQAQPEACWQAIEAFLRERVFTG
ncbi:MAG: alpha/beta hydrolase [Sandaracinaceae bacterium]|nr:alpha/beta hydrolase [Sandaracinaceae bacterium]MBK8412523.1 alpha/beta hydrolase [Sandaracinaceae bacterium]MBP7684748.1 alpha/beta hydrolase [Deltaproteobacteria bacterium]